MKKTISSCLIILGFLGLTFMFSADRAHSAKPIHYSTMFNPKTVGAVSGEVVRLEQVPSGNRRDLCVQAVLKTPQGQVTAVLGPKTYMTKHQLTVAPQDRLTITGSRISILGKPFILATEVKGDRTMKLREAGGRPLWAVGEDWHIQ
jgi:hypothetical protein